MAEIKISIIIPAYNLVHYIENCLSGVFAQTYKNIEVIVVDDGSSDGTGNLLDKIAESEPRMRVFHQENSGVTAARLRGAREATGDYIGFVDGDDEIEPDMYERLIDNALKYNADISHCGYQMVFPSRVDYYYNTGRLVKQDRTAGLKDLLEGSFIEPGLWNKLFHKSLFHSLLHRGVMDTDIRNLEDLLMNFYLFREAESAVYEDFCPYHYMVREGSAANKQLNEHQLKDPLKVFEIIRDELADDELRKTAKCKVLRRMVAVAAMGCKNQPDFVSEYSRDIHRELKAMLPQVLRDKSYGTKDTLKALWAGLWPGSYRCVHRVYEKITGIDRKYEIC